MNYEAYKKICQADTQFYSTDMCDLQTVSTAVELRKPVYKTVAMKTLHYENVLAMMSSVKWDVKDIMSQHSSYVDVMLQVPTWS